VATPADITAVRFYVGDPAGADQQLSDADITFALDQTNDSHLAAAAVCARALAARYARKVDTRFETVESKYSQLRDNFNNLARQLDQQAKKPGAGLGLPVAGGMSKAEVESVRTDTDRVPPYFFDNMFTNPPAPNE
jgi:hypothetical protein